MRRSGPKLRHYSYFGIRLEGPRTNHGNVSQDRQSPARGLIPDPPEHEKQACYPPDSDYCYEPSGLPLYPV